MWRKRRGPWLILYLEDEMSQEFEQKTLEYSHWEDCSSQNLSGVSSRSGNFKNIIYHSTFVFVKFSLYFNILENLVANKNTETPFLLRYID